MSSRKDAMSELERVFQSGRIGSMELRNRIIMSPMGMMFREDFVDWKLNQAVIDFYVERARGGVALILVSPSFTEHLGRAYQASLGIYDDRFIPGLKALTSAIHEHGARVGLQVIHGGKYAPSSIIGAQAVSPSAVFSNWTREMPRELTTPEIKETVRNFARAVQRAKEAGFDTVEFNAYSGYLIREFLSPLTNQRSDEYGDSLENRFRFLREIIEATREAVGEEYPLICKISGAEYLPGGNTLEETRYFAQGLETLGVAALHVSPGGHETMLPLTPGIVPKGAFLYLAQAVKEVVQVPVITAHIGDLPLAESVLEEGKADFIALGRPLLADPDLPVKAREGRTGDIRRCIRCLQGCYDRLFTGQQASCVVNPAVGREREFEIRPVTARKRVMVVGGGPAGMETARVLALRGHQVSLYEKEGRLGGQVNYASVAPGKEEFESLTDYLAGQIAKLGVEVHLQQEVTPQLVEQEAPEAVVMATGARPLLPDIPGVDRANVYTADQVLAGRAEVGQRVVVVGGGGIGCETALYLARKGSMDAETALFLVNWGALDPETALGLTRKGKVVTLVEMLEAVGRDIGISRRGPTRRLLRHYGVQTLTGTQVKAITEEGVVVEKEGQRQTLPADIVVLAAGTRSENSLYQALQGKVPELYLIGDAREPRKVLEAMAEAAAVARQI